MTATALVTALHARGLRLWAEFHVVPRRLLTDDDRAALRANKPAVLALLADLEALERDGMAAWLRAVAATLSAEEHQRLAHEAASGDRLAELITAVLGSAVVPEGR
jgi:hypothetical protein